MTDRTEVATGAPLSNGDRKREARVRRGRQRLPVAGREGRPMGDERDETGEAKGQIRIVAGRFFRQPRAVAGLVVFAVMGFGALIVSAVWQYSFTQITGDFARIQYKMGANGKLTVASAVGGPTARHPFGVDQIGHDVLAQVMRGTLSDIKTAFVVAALALLIGTVLGSLAGFYGRWVDSVLMRTTDVFLAVPILIILVVLSNRWHSSWLVIAVIIGLLAWTYLARLIRADFLSLRERDFVEAARAIGASDVRIITRHMLPNAIGPIIVNGTLTVANAIVLESTLSFLGLGIQPPDVSLGYLVANGAEYATSQWWLFAFPAIFIVVLILCVNLIGDGLREAFDPRKVRVRQ
jgi:peptide/nickel transport system permease protein